jgi:hypothetical protein
MRTGNQKLGAQGKRTQLRENPYFVVRHFEVETKLDTCLIVGRFFILEKNKCIYKNGLRNAHPALCSTVL